MQRWRKVAIGVIALFVLLVLGAYVLYGGGEVEGRGRVHPFTLASSRIAERTARQADARQGPKRAEESMKGPGAKQILFGDLHVHTTFSTDAFVISLPLLAGEGAHPPGDACDFARFCSGLDFFAITDHAEALTPRRWQETKQSVRECNAVADPDTPDVVAFVGFEWTQVGRTPEEHYGHRNVVLRDTDEEALPTRPIAASGVAAEAMESGGEGIGVGRLLSVPLLDFENRQRYKDLIVYARETAGVPPCPKGRGVRELPAGCREIAATPEELFDKLRQWSSESLVIPHGTTWGFYTPPGYRFDESLGKKQHDAERQRLVEVYSGHGNSEEHRSWREVAVDADGAMRCPAPTADYEPCCWRAGEIIRERCGDAPAEECEERVIEARRLYVQASTAGHLTVPGAAVEDWKDCGQCRDCFLPSFNYRPGGSVQYMLATGDFSDPAAPSFVTLGFIASSDNHKARPGTGYKEYGRRKMTEATGGRTVEWQQRIFGEPGDKSPRAEPWSDERRRNTPPFVVLHAERQASFFLTGGLVAVHAEGRDRSAIWEALRRREVYGTSGPRILLWFDLANAPGGVAPMGSEVKLGEAPRFTVRAAGALEELPGCPEAEPHGMPAERLAALCAGECHRPGDRRLGIARIELVRIRRRRSADEPVSSLIDDVLESVECGGKPVCTVELEDSGFVEGARDAIYYVRAIQRSTPAVNAASLRCDKGDNGGCARARPCYGDARTPLDDDCLAPVEERAWSSPIYVSFDAEAARRVRDKEGSDGKK